MNEEILRVDNLNITSNQEMFLKNIHLNLFKGELLTLFGVHKSGKTLLAKAISGFQQISSGDIYYNNTLISPYTYEEAQTYGIFYLYRDSMLIPSMSVIDNIFAIRKHSVRNSFYNPASLRSSASVFFGQYHIDLPLDTLVRDLNGFEILLVQIFKAVLMDAKIIILDDYCASIYTAHYPILKRLLGDLKDIAFIYISNGIDPMVECSNRIAIMSRGRIVKYIYENEYSPSLLIHCAYGHYWNDSFYRKMGTPGQEVLKVHKMPVGDKLLSLTVAAGEVVGIYDVDGQGQKIIEQLTQNPIDNVYIKGRKVMTYMEAVENGMAVISGQYYKTDYFSCFSSVENITFQNLKSMSRLGVVKHRVKKYFEKQYSDDLLHTKNTSSKNWYILKSILYRKLSACPSVLIVDNISSGFSLRVRQEIFELLDKAAGNGVGILFIFSDLVECFEFCDHIFIPNTAHEEYLSLTPKETDLEHVIPLIQI